MKRFVVLLMVAVFLLLGNLNAQDDGYKGLINPSGDVYRVALMVPLYLDQVTPEFSEETPNNKMLLTKPFSFLHFYEGFMIAVDSMVNSRGMKLDLKVYDVDNSVEKADMSIADPWLKSADVIVGPFYIKPFEKVKEFASTNGIVIVNPITQRSGIVDGKPYVVKVKPSLDSQLTNLEMLIKDHYHSNNIFIISKDGIADAMMIDGINRVARNNMDSLSYVHNSHIIKTIKKYHKRWKFLKVDFDETEFLTDNLKLDVALLESRKGDSTAFENHIVTINYGRDSLRNVSKYASTMRNNLFIVYGNDKVFASEIVNKVTKLTEYYPLTVIMMPEWSKFDMLFNENLMKMKAVYFDDTYVDYQNIRVMSFINKFRKMYSTEPQDYAYQGFDIGWYFLNALRDFGKDMLNHLPEYNVPLLDTAFHFEKKDANSGYENVFWHVYQFKGYNKIIVEPLNREESWRSSIKDMFYHD